MSICASRMCTASDVTPEMRPGISSWRFAGKGWSPARSIATSPSMTSARMPNSPVASGLPSTITRPRSSSARCTPPMTRRRSSTVSTSPRQRVNPTTGAVAPGSGTRSTSWTTAKTNRDSIAYRSRPTVKASISAPVGAVASRSSRRARRRARVFEYFFRRSCSDRSFGVLMRQTRDGRVSPARASSRADVRPALRRWPEPLASDGIAASNRSETVNARSAPSLSPLLTNALPNASCATIIDRSR